VRARGRDSSRDREEREERRDSGVRDLVERLPISPGQRRQWNSSNRRISYHERAATLDIQHPRSPTLASCRHNSIVITDAARDRPVESHQLRRGRTAQEGARGGRRIERHMRGSRDPSGQSSEPAEGEWNGKERRRDGRRGGGRAGIYGRREKRRGSAARAFPDQGAAKLGGADRTTEITYFNPFQLKGTY
jgi:hypothetical protein